MSAPSGPTHIRGTIVHTKFQENDWGGAYKMMVRVPTKGGEYRVWSTLPQKLLDAAEKHLENESGHIHSLLGCEVEFDATLNPKSGEPDFAFADRPTKARLLSWPKGKERKS